MPTFCAVPHRPLRSSPSTNRRQLLEPLESRLLLSHSTANIINSWTLAGTDADGSVHFNGSGIVDGGSITDSSGSNVTPTGAYTVSRSGAVSVNVNGPSTGQLNTTNDLFDLTNSEGDFNILVDSNRAAFSNADLSGPWTLAYNGDEPDSNGVGTVIFNGAGRVTGGTAVDGVHTSAVTGGSYSISPSGAVSITITTQHAGGSVDSVSFVGALNDSKDVLILSPTDIQSAVADTDSTLITLVHSKGTYSNASAAGTWAINSEDTTGSITLDGAGHITGTVDNNHTPSSVSGSYSVSPNGTLTLNVTNSKGTFSFTGAMNASRNTIIMNHAAPTATDFLIVLINSTDRPPTLTTVAPFSTATEQQPFTITGAQLLAHSNATDPDGDPISFTISSVTTGTLRVDGRAVVPGHTTVASTDTISWTPAARANGLISAFSIEASDGTLSSSTPIPVKINTILLPTLSIIASKPAASELNPTTTGLGRFTLTRSGNLAQPLTAHFTISGTALNGTDYIAVPAAVTFAARSAVAIINITPIDHIKIEGSRLVTLTLRTDTAIPPTYTVGSPKTATVTIADHQLSPATIAGKTFNLTIANGAAPFATTGTEKILFASTGNTYHLIGGPGNPSSTGTFTYTKTGAALANVTFSDSFIGAGSGNLTFSTATNATFLFSLTTSNATQHGALTIT